MYLGVSRHSVHVTGSTSIWGKERNKQINCRLKREYTEHCINLELVKIYTCTVYIYIFNIKGDAKIKCPLYMYHR